MTNMRVLFISALCVSASSAFHMVLKQRPDQYAVMTQSLHLQKLSMLRSVGQLSRAASCDFHHYAALGDSYAAGIQADPDATLPICNGSNGGDSGPYCTTKTCAKNEGAYPWLLYQKYQPTEQFFDFFACSGANTQDCLTLQVPRINSSSDLITINIGGNNNDMFSKIVTRCVYVPKQIGCSGALSNAERTIDNIKDALINVIRELNIRAPNAKVAVMSYVKFWPQVDNSTQCQSHSLRRPTADQKTLMNTLVVRLNGVLAEVASEVQAHFVDVDPYFADHRLCDVGDPYIQWSLIGLPGHDDGNGEDEDDPNANLFNMGVFHPFKTGHEMYLKAIADCFKC